LTLKENAMQIKRPRDEGAALDHSTLLALQRQLPPQIKG